MEYVSYIAFIVFFIFMAKRFFFVANHKNEDVDNIVEKEELVIEKTEAETEIEEEIKEEIEEILYEMNTHSIKISLYPSSTFSSYTMINLYKEIIVNNYWINEPFHSSFIKILYCVDKNSFWIQSSRSKEIIINFRNFDGEEERDTAVRVFDLKEILNDVVLEIDWHAHKYLSKQCMQILLLSSMIYTISKCGNLNTLLEKKDDDIDMLALLIEIFCIEFSEEIKNKIIPTNNINLNLIEKVYNAAIERAKEYPNYLGDNSAQKKEIKMLQNLQQKRLLTVRDY